MSDSSIKAANSGFAFRLFGELARRQPDKNIFISPLSVSLALAVALGGAAGATRDAIASSLGLEGMEDDAIDRAFGALLDALGALDTRTRLQIATALFAQQGVAFEQPFLRRSGERYRAEVAPVSFRDAATLARINGWVSRNTNGKIAKILDQLDPLTVLVLLNAVYFKGAWATAFDPAKTRELPFHTPRGARPHPLMAQTGSLECFSSGAFAAARLPYGDGRLAMIVLLPSEESSLPELIATLNETSWEKWAGSLRKRQGTIMLPRWRLEYETQLNGPLAALGMGVAFDPQRADFSRMARLERDQPISISEVKHKSFVEVNEEGTEAAAVTSVTFRTLGMASDRTFRMVVDRPFFFAITDRQTGAILFMGAIVDP